jgi:hypothetical protein
MIRTAMAILLLSVAPAVAQEACSVWTAGMQEDEGGPVFTASACAIDRPDAYLLLTCSQGEVFIRYDLAAGAERAPDLGEVTDVDFTIGVSTQQLSMSYQEMDGMFAGDVPANGPLMALMKTGEALSIVDAAGRYPVHDFGLAGSSSALARLVAQCR